MIDKQEIELERAEKEYIHAVSELSRYESDSQKLASLISLLITAAFVIGVGTGVKSIFPVIPILAFTVIQYLISNNYAYRVREAYVHRLEETLRSGISRFPALYGGQIKRHYLDLSWYELFLLPFTGIVVYTVAIVLIISLFAVMKSVCYLDSLTKPLPGHLLGAIYIIACIGMAAYAIFSLIWTARKLAKVKTWLDPK